MALFALLVGLLRPCLTSLLPRQQGLRAEEPGNSIVASQASLTKHVVGAPFAPSMQQIASSRRGFLYDRKIRIAESVLDSVVATLSPASLEANASQSALAERRKGNSPRIRQFLSCNTRESRTRIGSRTPELYIAY